MIDTNGIAIIRRIKEKKQDMLQRLFLDINPESDEKKYTRNAVLKMTIAKIDEVIDELLQEEKKMNHESLANGRIQTKLFETRKKELDDMRENIHTVQVSTIITKK